MFVKIHQKIILPPKKKRSCPAAENRILLKNIWTVQESEEEGDEKKKEHPLKLLQNSIQDHYEAYPNLNQTKVIM